MPSDREPNEGADVPREPTEEELLSPELALVDPENAERARRALPEISLFEDRLRAGQPEGARSTVPPSYAEIRDAFAESNARDALVEEHARRRRKRLLVGPLVLVVLAVLGAAGYLLAANAPSWLHGEESAPSAAQSTAPRERRIPDFVWVAVPGAASYDVEFRRDGRIVLAATTRSARLRVDPERLPPGRYRWRVWSVDRAGARARTPLVDSVVTVQ